MSEESQQSTVEVKIEHQPYEDDDESEDQQKTDREDQQGEPEL